MAVRRGIYRCMGRDILLGSTGRIGAAVLAAWPGPPPLAHARRGADLPWDMTVPPPPLDLAGGAVIDLTGAVPGRSVDPADNTSLAMAALDAGRGWSAGHVFVMSSSGIYGPTGAAPAGEATPPDPRGPYPEAKLAMELAMATARRPGDPGLTVLRLANVAGASAPWGAGASPVLDRFADGGGPVRSYIGPVTLARILARLADLARRRVSLPALLNVAAPRPTAMADILSAVGTPPGWRDARAGAIARVVLDTARLQSLCPLPQDCGDAAALVAEAWSVLPSTAAAPT